MYLCYHSYDAACWFTLVYQFSACAIQNIYLPFSVLADREWPHVITHTCLNWAVATISSTWSTSSSPRCLSITCTRDSPLWPESASMWVTVSSVGQCLLARSRLFMHDVALTWQEVHQSMAFTKLWFVLKSVLCPISIAVLIWFRYRMGTADNSQQRTLQQRYSLTNFYSITPITL